MGRLGNQARALSARRAHERVHPGLPVITLGAGDKLAALRAYESGSDHDRPDTTGYLPLRTVLSAVIRRTLEDVCARHLHVGPIDIDLAAGTVAVADTPVHVSRLEFELLAKFASDPLRVFSKHEFARCMGAADFRTRRRQPRRPPGNRLVDAGAGPVLVNKWGRGWSLTTPH